MNAERPLQLHRPMRTVGLGLFFACVLAFTVGCAPAGDDDDDSSPTPTPTPTAAPFPAPDLVNPATADRIQVLGDTGSVKGIFDPSYVVPSPTGIGLLAYSSVTATQEVFTRLAVTTNGGTSWVYLRDVNTIDATTISDPTLTVCGAATCVGDLLHETSTLVYDATDPDASKRWKIFAHTYFFDGAIHYVQGWMSMYTAAEPQLAWTETKLFGWDAGAPTSTAGVAINVKDIAGLEECTIISEPAAAIWNGEIQLALGCIDASVLPATIHIELLRSADHGVSWTRKSTPLAPADVTALGAAGNKVNAAHLAVLGGSLYLSVTPTSAAFDYQGCWIFEFDDPDAGTLVRDSSGRPVVQRVLDTTVPGFNGACATDEGVAGGWTISILQTSDTDLFQLYRSGIAAP